MTRFAPPSLLLIVSVFVATPALAWQQTTTCIDEEPPAPTSTPYCEGNEFPVGFRWEQAAMTYVVSGQGIAEFGEGDEISDRLLETIQTSFETWNEPDCSIFEFQNGGLTETDRFISDDGENVVVFHDESWPYSSGALALTSVTADSNGVIVNADMEINGVDHVFADAETETDKWDVQNTVTHEAGHMLGLDHTGVDDATMAFDARPGEIKKRDLHPDDIEGLCTIYDPANFDGDGNGQNPDPEPPDDGCCAVVDGGVSSGAAWLAALLLLVTAGRRRFPR